MTKFKELFSFTKGEQRGIILLSVLILLFGIARWCLNNYYTQPSIDLSKYEKEICDFEALLAENEQKKTAKEETLFEQELFVFNPNTLQKKDWIRLGVKPWQIKIINKYISRGGRFRIKSDFKKIYGISKELYSVLHPYIDLPESFKNESFKRAKTREKVNKSETLKIARIKISINTADTTILKEIKGIGSKLSKRIIKYRDKLGGFRYTNQIREVYGLKDDVANELIKVISIDTSEIKKIDINTCTKKELSTHPYIDWKVANAIVVYRKTHRGYLDVSDVKNSHLVTDELYLKIAPYFKTE